MPRWGIRTVAVAIGLALAPPAAAQAPAGSVPAGAASAVSLSGLVGCALRADATLACWGTDQYAPTQSAPPGGAFRAVSVGNQHACGIRVDGSVVCWGSDSAHQATPPGGTFTAVSAGNVFSCGLRPDASIACWGAVAAPPAGAFSAVAAGLDDGCAIRTDGALACWGTNLDGQTSPPAGTFRSVDIDRYSSNEQYACGVRTDGSISCWGDTSLLQAAPPSGSFLTVSVGVTHACAIGTDHTLTCWGYDMIGEADPPPGSFDALTVGFHASCAIRTQTKAIVCWPGQLTAVTIPASKAFTLPAGHRCVSHRRFTVHVRRLAGVTWTSAVVTLRGKPIRTVKGARITAPINLTGLPKGRFTVSITATASDGRTASGTRTYHTCVPRRQSAEPPL